MDITPKFELGQAVQLAGSERYSDRGVVEARFVNLDTNVVEYSVRVAVAQNQASVMIHEACLEAVPPKN